MAVVADGQSTRGGGADILNAKFTFVHHISYSTN